MVNPRKKNSPSLLYGRHLVVSYHAFAESRALTEAVGGRDGQTWGRSVELSC